MYINIHIPIREFSFHLTENAGRDGSVGIAICCGLDGPGIECRSRWPRDLRRTSLASYLLGLRFRIPRGAWMFVFCVCCTLMTKGKKQGLSRQETSTDRLHRENKRIRILMGPRFSDSVAHPVSYRVGTGSLFRR